MDNTNFKGCECPQTRDTVKSVLVNIHLKDTKPELRPRVHNPAFDKVFPLSTIRNVMYAEVRSLLNHPSKSKYSVTSTRELKHHELGIARGYGSKPDEVNNLNTTFGCRKSLGPKLYEIVMPPDVPKEVQEAWKTRDIVFKRVYNYNESFQPTYAFGNYNGASKSSRCIERCMNWIYHPANICVISEIQCKYLDRTVAPDGVVLEPIKNRLCVPTDFVYGFKPEVVMQSVADVMRECPPCPFKDKIREAVAHMNSIRLVLKHREEFPFPEILEAFKAFDTKKLGVLPCNAAFLLLQKLRIAAKLPVLEPLLRFMDILDDDNNIHYEELITIFNHHKPYPHIKKIQDTPKEHRHYITTYGDLLLDAEKPFVPNARDKNKRHDCDTTHIINPSRCERNGLWHKDYTKGRTKEFMQELFAASGFELGNEDFDQCWTECVRIDEPLLSGLVCVETFLNYVDKTFKKTN